MSAATQARRASRRSVSGILDYLRSSGDSDRARRTRLDTDGPLGRFQPVEGRHGDPIASLYSSAGHDGSGRGTFGTHRSGVLQ
jgi:hypothetical protein